MISELPAHIKLPEPKLAFHPSYEDSTDIHPLRGLSKFGPYSQSFFADPIRIATLAPRGKTGLVNSLMRDLKRPVQLHKPADFKIDWPSFETIFRVQIEPAPPECRIELPDDLSSRLRTAEKPSSVLVEILDGYIKEIAESRYKFDVLLLLIPKEWEAYSSDYGNNFDLHDHLKAMCAVRKIPIQILKESGAVSFYDRASVMWRIGVALYAKAGGIPWKIAAGDTDTAHIGLSYALRPGPDGETEFVTCCSQVFDNEGSGLEFVAYNTDEAEGMRRGNPFLSRMEMFRVMTRSLDLYRRRHAGRIPKNIVIHKSTEFRAPEIDACMDAFHLCENIDLIRVVQNVGWRGILIDQANGAKGARFPVERGTLLNIGDREALLWVHGSVQQGLNNSPYFQGKRSTPQPIKLIRDGGHGSWERTAAATLALSKMDWNNDALYGQLPVTLSYSSVLANVIKRMTKIGSEPYEYRYFM